MEIPPANGGSTPVPATRFNHCHLALGAGLAFTLIGGAATVWDWSSEGAQAQLVDWTLSGVLGGLTLVYAFLSLLGRTYEHSDRVWYRNFTPEGRVAIVILFLTIAAGATRTLVGDAHQARKVMSDAETDSIRIARLHQRVDQRADSTIAVLRAEERRSRDTLQARSDEIVELVNSDMQAVGDGLHSFLRTNSRHLTEQQRQQVYALMQQISTADDSTSQRTARLRSYIEDYATRSTEMNGRTLAELQTLTDPANGVIHTTNARTAEARDSVVRAVDTRFGSLQSGFAETFGGVSQSLAACRVDAEQLGPQLTRFARLVDSLANVPARPSVQAAQSQTGADSGRTTEGR